MGNNRIYCILQMVSKKRKTVSRGIGTQLFRSLSSYKFGKNFEAATVNCLKQYSFDIAGCGRRGDRGVDFRGEWHLGLRRVSVIGQCKHFRGRTKAKVGPVHLREVEGVLSHEHCNTLALLVTNTGFTNMAYQHFMSSSYPVALAVISCQSLSSQDTSCQVHKPNCMQDTMDIHRTKQCNVMNDGKIQMRGDSTGKSSEGSILNLGQQGEGKMESEKEQGIRDNALDKQYRRFPVGIEETKSMSSMPCKLSQNSSGYNSIECDEQDINDNSDPLSSDFDSWKLSLFEMNVPARTLMPGVVVGQKLSPGSRSINLVLFENDRYTQIWKG